MIQVANEGQPSFKHLICGYSYNQNAWSYSSENIVMPLGQAKIISLHLNEARKGKSQVTVYLVGYR